MEFSLAGKTYLATRYKLKEWLRLDFLRGKLLDAVQIKDIHKIADTFCAYVSFVSKQNVTDLPWYEVAEAFSIVEQENRPTLPFSILTIRSKKQEHVAWEYEGRDWYWWANLLSSKYNWSLEYIAELDIDDATGLLQEILVDEQLKKEWEWSLTELAYPYNSNTKTSNFKPLDRPDWMHPKQTDEKKDLPIYRIRRDLMPLGVIIRSDGETIIN